MTGIKVGDRVTYSGSLTYYHEFEFSVLELFTFNGGVECAMLQGPRLDIWIRRCRVSNLTLVQDETCPACDAPSDYIDTDGDRKWCERCDWCDKGERPEES